MTTAVLWYVAPYRSCANRCMRQPVYADTRPSLISYHYLAIVWRTKPIAVAARSKAWNVFAHLNTGIVGSNPTQGMDVCVYSVFVWGSGLATGWFPVQKVLPTVLRLRNWTDTKRFTDEEEEEEEEEWRNKTKSTASFTTYGIGLSLADN
jgi:hypothetical protein